MAEHTVPTPLSEEGRPQYGNARDNFSLAYRLREDFRVYAIGVDLPDATIHACEMIMVKLARIATGIAIEDNYDDIVGYAKLAKQCDHRLTKKV
jgi:hypothetical protein